jgi:hypothetical protein
MIAQIIFVILVGIATYFFVKSLGKIRRNILLGKDNENINNINKMNNLVDDAYYKTISECKLLYYHSKEPRHLHYHPLEAIIIGIPVIFYEESLLNSYLNNSPGKCKTLKEVCSKIDKIFNNDIEFINKIILEQNKIIHHLKRENNISIFNKLLNHQINDQINDNETLTQKENQTPSTNLYNTSISKNIKQKKQQLRQRVIQQIRYQIQQKQKHIKSSFNIINYVDRSINKDNKISHRPDLILSKK